METELFPYHREGVDFLSQTSNNPQPEQSSCSGLFCGQSCLGRFALMRSLISISARINTAMTMNANSAFISSFHHFIIIHPVFFDNEVVDDELLTLGGVLTHVVSQ